MLSLLKKEINGFLSSLIGYLVIVVFLVTLSLFMWVFPLEMNVLNGGYANLDGLFLLAPWVFMFLAPAITMRSFSEEQRTGTIELLLTRPLSDWQIIFAKYLAGFLLVLFSLLPTLIYYFSVYRLGSPAGNVDSGGVWGSYFGLLFLSGAFVAIGIFASSMTKNQIVAFIISVFLSFFCFIGFETISSLSLLGSLDNLLLQMGINDHYKSMSRGVIDTRDVLYFFSIIGLFLLLTKTRLESRKW